MSKKNIKIKVYSHYYPPYLSFNHANFIIGPALPPDPFREGQGRGRITRRRRKKGYEKERRRKEKKGD
jgi:hypothetical protein